MISKRTTEVIYIKYKSFIFLLILSSVHRWLFFTLWVDNFLEVAADDMIKLSLEEDQNNRVRLLASHHLPSTSLRSLLHTHIEGPQVQHHGPEYPVGCFISLMHQGPVIHLGSRKQN